jgi:NAD(P)H-hydrate epimerase
MSKLTVPSLTPEQMKQVDDLMIKYFGIKILQMMEHDARGLVEVAKDLFRGSVKDKKVLIMSGKGGNGAGGLASSRHFYNAGAEVKVLLTGSDRSLNTEGKHHLKTTKKLNIPILDPKFKLTDFKFDLVIDALLGYSAQGDPRSPYDELILTIHELQRQGAKVLANDLPSGLDPLSGLPHKPCVRADATMTVALPKVGMFEEQAREWIGQHYLTDIGVPIELYERIGVDVPRDLFAKEWILKLK